MQTYSRHWITRLSEVVAAGGDSDYTFEDLVRLCMTAHARHADAPKSYDYPRRGPQLNHNDLQDSEPA